MVKEVAAFVPSVGSTFGMAPAQASAPAVLDQSNKSPGATMPDSVISAAVPAVIVVGLMAVTTLALVVCRTGWQ